MKVKYIIRNAINGEYLTGADWDGVYFGLDYIKFFETDKEALDKLEYEYSLFPSQFRGMILEIVKIYTP